MSIALFTKYVSVYSELTHRELGHAMHTLSYNQPNFKATFNGRGFVSYCRPEERRCTAFWVTMTAGLLVKEGKASELLEIPGGLPSDFKEDGRSEDLLTIKGLDRLSWQLGGCEPYSMSVAQAYELAQLAVALLNYDAYHADDETPLLCAVSEREIVIDMIKLVHVAADDSTLLDDLIELDPLTLAAKGTHQRLCSTRP